MLLSWLLIIGGIILLIDGVASIVVFWGQPVFNQLVRVERTVFAVVLVIAGVLL